MQSLCIEENILVVAPHPDDETIGAGGLLIKYPSRCTVVVATDGSRAGNEIDKKGMADVRKKEFVHAMKKVGVDKYIFIDISDSELCNHPGFLAQIDLSSYGKVFIPYCKENHPDHMSAFSYTIQELIRQKAYTTEIYQYETRGTMTDADYYLDISDVIEKKKEMIYCYRSQIEIFDHAIFAEAFNRLRAASAGKNIGYYEVYKQCGLNIANNEEYDDNARDLSRFRLENGILRRWLELRINKDLYAQIRKCGIDTVAIYGYGFIGRLLAKDLIKNGIKVSYIIDRNKISDDEITILKPGIKYSDVDVMLVSTLFDIDSIVRELEELGYMRVVALADFFMEIERYGEDKK